MKVGALLLLAAIIAVGGCVSQTQPATTTVPVQQSQISEKFCGSWPGETRILEGQFLIPVSENPEWFPKDFPLYGKSKIVAIFGNVGSGIISRKSAYFCSDGTVKDIFDFYKTIGSSWEIRGDYLPPELNRQRLPDGSTDAQYLLASKRTGNIIEQIGISIYDEPSGKTIIDYYYDKQDLGE